MIFTALLTEKKQLDSHVWHCVFAMPKDETLTFDPGQYLMIEVGDIRRRPYSIAGASEDGKEFTLLVDTSHQGLGSKFFESLEINHNVKMQGPFGLNTLEVGAASYLFIAAGVGIAPFMPMVHALLKENFAGLIQFIQGARTASEILCAEEFSQLQKTHSNFTWIQSLSKEDLPTAFHGRTSDWITAHYAPQPNELIYLCGSPEMVRDCRTNLIQKGALPGSLKIEVFS